MIRIAIIIIDNAIMQQPKKIVEISLFISSLSSFFISLKLL